MLKIWKTLERILRSKVTDISLVNEINGRAATGGKGTILHARNFGLTRGPSMVTSMADGSIGVYDQARTKDRFTLVLLKNENRFLWPKYFMEERRSNDTVYPDRIGLFGGRIEPGETSRECAVREIHEETGIHIAQSDLVSLLEFKGETDKGDVNEGEIFLYTFLGKHRTSVSKIRRAQKLLMKHLKDLDDAPGEPVSIGAWRWPVWKTWYKMTPQAAYALLADYDRIQRND